jgi:disulfide bond formation protein DsbB
MCCRKAAEAAPGCRVIERGVAVRSPANPLKSPAYKAGALALLLSVGVILAALAFEYLGGYRPCPLCLQQRYAYYAGIPALFVALIVLASGRPTAAATLFLLISLAFLANAGLGVYHAGVEWKFWPGPDTCAATLQPLTPNAGALKGSLPNIRIIRCDEAPWQFLGLSFAGWNVVASMLLWITSLQAAFAAPGTQTASRMAQGRQLHP